jgi:hypothetical protein
LARPAEITPFAAFNCNKLSFEVVSNSTFTLSSLNTCPTREIRRGFFQARRIAVNFVKLPELLSKP